MSSIDVAYCNPKLFWFDRVHFFGLSFLSFSLFLKKKKKINVIETTKKIYGKPCVKGKRVLHFGLSTYSNSIHGIFFTAILEIFSLIFSFSKVYFTYRILTMSEMKLVCINLFIFLIKREKERNEECVEVWKNRAIPNFLVWPRPVGHYRIFPRDELDFFDFLFQTFLLFCSFLFPFSFFISS